MLKQSKTPVHLDRVYETDMAEGLKAMALEGHGIAFLPSSAVRKEVRAKKLVSAGGGLETELDIRLYRARTLDPQKGKRAVQQFWNRLSEALASRPV